MARSNVLINSLNSGEVSELIESRSDLSKYSAACKTLENALPLVEGGAKRRPGTTFAGIAANGGPLGTPTSGKSRLVPFQFSTDQNAILEFFAGGIRVWENGGLALSPASLSDWAVGTTYGLGPPASQVLVGSYFESGAFGGNPKLIVQAPYGQTSAIGVTIGTVTNSADTLSAVALGTSPNQYILISIANATAANNSAANIQAAIRALVSLNAPGSSSYVDLSAWQAYWQPVATPPISIPGFYLTVVAVGKIFQSTINANTGNFPVGSADWVETEDINSGIPIVLTTPYAEADLFELDVSTQSADVLYVTHFLYPPASVNRFSNLNWSYAALSLYGTLDVVKTGYNGLGQSISAITAANPAVVMVASNNQPFQNGDRIYINEVAGMVELNEGQFIVGSVTEVTSGWSFTLSDPVTGSGVDSTNYLAYVGGGFAVATPALFNMVATYPACAALFEQRFCLAGALNTPTQMNGSVQDDYSDFICDPNEDDYAIQFTLVSQQVDQIRWMIGSPNALLLGTAGGVWAMYTADGSSLSQTDVTAAKQMNIGVGNVAPQLVNDSVIWVSRSARTVRLLLFNFVTNQWESPDLTRLNRRITIGATEATSGIIQTAFQKEPYPIFWAVRADGQLIGMTYERDDQVFAWFRVKMDGLIESVACVSSDNAEDQVWIVVNRTVNGVAQRYVEYFMPHEIFGDLANAFFVDCGLQWDGGDPVAITGITQANPPVVTATAHGFATGYSVQIAGVLGMTEINSAGPASAYTITVIDPDTFSLDGMDSTAFGAYTSGGTATRVTNTVTGLQYLQGKTVVAVGDGAKIFEDVVPSSGTTIFATYANLVTIGLPYKTVIEPLNPVIGNAQQTSKSKKQKFSRAGLSLWQSIGGKVGNDWKHLHAMAYGSGAKGLPPSLFTGNIVRDLDGDWGDEDTILITQEEPFPFCLRSIEPRLDVAEGG